MTEVLLEYQNARRTHAPFNSTHEGYAVLLEEVDELWDEVRERQPNPTRLRKEAIQVAAMALAFAVECA
jgi:hypothetical protein